VLLPERFDDDVRRAVRARLSSLVVRRLSSVTQRAAVLVPLCDVDGAASILFTKRTETVGTHKGHVAFPGGRADPGDRDAVDTALRELEEEVGIERSDVEVLGACHEVTAITGVGVSPIVGYVGSVDVTTLRLQPTETESAFTLPLPSLVDPRHRTLQVLGMRRAPQFTAGPHRVWGLTAWILDEFLIEGLGLELPRLM
jgi:nudix motif 8